MKLKWFRMGVVLGAAMLALSCGGGKQSSVPPASTPWRASVSSQSSDWTTGVPARHSDEPAPVGRGLRAPPLSPPTTNNQQPTTSLSQALADLDALPTPEGVDEAVFAELKSALREALAESVGRGFIPAEDAAGLKSSPTQTIKLVSRPPTGEANRVTDLAFTDNGDGTYALTWSYRNVGDYNQDGIVSIQDITPLAVHFGEFSDGESGWTHPVDEVVDGNGDTAITIADITPLAIHFQSDVEKYALESGTAAKGNYSQFSEVPFGGASGEGRKRFGVLGDSQREKWVRVVPVDSFGVRGEESEPVWIPPAPPPPPENEPPVAALRADVSVGEAPLIVNFDASESYDPDGTITAFYWDWEGDGVYDYGSGTVPAITYAYLAGGTYDATVLVKDNDDGTAIATVTVTATMPANQAPVGVLSVEPAYGDAPLMVTLDASESYDPEGVTLGYEWDWEGDGTYDFDSDTVAAVQHTYEAAGAFNPTVRVTDDEWASGEAAATLVVYGVDSGDWWMFGRELKHNRRSPRVGPQAPNVKWAFQTGDAVNSGPAIGADGTIYVGSYDYYLYAINPDGTLKWRFPTGYAIRSSPAIGTDQTIYVGSHDTYLYAINPDGTLRWRFKTDGRVRSSPAIGVDGTIYFGSEDHNFYALNPDGTLRWSYETGAWVRSSPAIADDGTIYVGSYDYYLYAFNPDGTVKWRFRAGDRIRSSPAIGVDGTVYVGSYDHNLYALNPDGTEKWRHSQVYWIRSSPAIAEDGTVYVGNFDAYLYAVKRDGKLKWQYETGDHVWSSPAIDGEGSIYVGSEDGNVYAFTAEGELKWQYQTGWGVGSSPAIGPDGTLYVGSWDGKLYAFGD